MTAHKTPYTRFFWSDWIADTSHLDLMQLGAYMRLLEFIYQHSKPLPGDLDRIYRICHATSSTEQTAIRLILDEYFKVWEDPEYGFVYRHFRAEREIEHAVTMHSERVLGAAKTNWIRHGDNKSKTMLLEAGMKLPSRSKQKGSRLATRSAHRPPARNQNQKKKKIYSSSKNIDILSSKEYSPKTEVSALEKKLPCPYRKIWELWVEVLPELPKPHDPDHWTPARKAKIRARWENQLPDLETWKKMFEYIRKSPWLMGQVEPQPGRKRFQTRLFWVIEPENLLKLREGNWHG